MEDYSQILDPYGIEFRPTEYYWQVGEIKKTQGWILHLSVIAAQLSALLKLTISVLLAEKVAFKIIRNPDTAKSILDGSLGYIHLGKVVSIYTQDDQKALTRPKN